MITNSVVIIRVILTLCFFVRIILLSAQTNYDVFKEGKGKLEVLIIASDSIQYFRNKDKNKPIEGAEIRISEISNPKDMFKGSSLNTEFKAELRKLGVRKTDKGGVKFYLYHQKAYMIDVIYDGYYKWNLILMAYVPEDEDSLGRPYKKPGFYGFHAKLIPTFFDADTNLEFRIAAFSRKDQRFTTREKRRTIIESKEDKKLADQNKNEKNALSTELPIQKRPMYSSVNVMSDGSTYELINGDTFNIITLDNLRQGEWIHFGSESGEGAYSPDSPWYQGFYKNNLRTKDWIKYFPDKDTAAIFNLDKDTMSGKFKFYYQNGKVHEVGFWDLKKNGLTGVYKEFYEEGGLYKEFQYDQLNQRQGKQIIYYTNGNYAIVSNMKNDTLHGYTNYFLDDGTLYLQQLYKNGKLINEKYIGDKNNFPDNLKKAFREVLIKKDSTIEKKVYSVLSDLSKIDSNYKLLLAQREHELREKNILLSEKERESIVMRNRLSKADIMAKLQLAELNRQRILNYTVLGVSFLMLVLVGLIYRNNIQKKRSNIILSKQKALLEEQHNEIQASINYARRIQEAILPPIKLIKEYLKESFIFYLPKDIVAGDFYWFEVNGDDLYFASADCTGHGVPGAMVSVVCANALNKAVNELKITEPASILDEVRSLVVETFKKSEEEVKDGMDISFCKLNLKTRELIFSGAQNPLYRVTSLSNSAADEKSLRNEYHELIEYKGDKQPIGSWAFARPFTQQKVQLLDGDIIYISTDGYSDQFGGEKGKKFMYKPFKELLLSLNSESMDSQKDILSQTFEKWKLGREQVDDVCVVGVKV